jgi:predicted DNA-binding transcriptional regulator YafY
MPITKNAAFRHRIIDSCLRNTLRPYPNIEQLQDQVTDALNLDNRISRSSIDKDMKAMRDFYKAPIAYDTYRRGYYYEDPNFSINSFPLTPEEIQILDLSTSFLKQIKYSGYFLQFESVIEKLISGFRISKIPGYEGRQFLEVEEPIADIGMKWLEPLYTAIIEKNPLVIQYKRFNQPDIKDHPFSIYAIREYRNRWYAVGYSERAETILTLALDRIVDIQKGVQSYRPAGDFSEADYFKYSFGVTAFNDATPYKVQLLFDYSTAGYILTKPLHASQQTQETHEGLLTEMECYLTPELEMMILSYGEKVKVLAPDVLARRIDERIRAMTYLYTKNDDHVGES